LNIGAHEAITLSNILVNNTEANILTHFVFTNKTENAGHSNNLSLEKPAFTWHTCLHELNLFADLLNLHV